MNPSFDLFLQEHRAGLLTPDEPQWIAGSRMNRRRLLRRGTAVIAGVAAAGFLPIGNNRADAAVPLLIRLAFGAAVSWLVEKTLDHLFDSYVAAKPTVVEASHRPTNGRNVFHDSHASDLEISGFTARETRTGHGLSASIDSHVFAAPTTELHKSFGLSCHDLNRVEAILLHTLYVDSCVTVVPFPTSMRQAGTEKDAKLINLLLRQQGYVPRGFTLQYKRNFSTLRHIHSIGYCLSHESLPGKKSLLFV